MIAAFRGHVEITKLLIKRGTDVDARKNDNGPFDTMPVNSYPTGNSTFGFQDGAGQVFEWTRSAYSKNIYVVKGGRGMTRGVAFASLRYVIPAPEIKTYTYRVSACAP
jgi:formylglycine-generating enzyme required for sulfatase activity